MSARTDTDDSAYESGTRVVAALLGLAAIGVLVGSPVLADAINRPETTPMSRLVSLALVSLVAALATTLLHGAWRLVGIAVATVPLLVVVAAYSRSA